MSYKIIFKTRWADFDPNNHMRHSAFNDYAAEARVRFFADHKFSISEFNKQNIGPVLFSENTNFYREINLSEDITVELLLKGISKNGERFKVQHSIFKENGVLAAQIEIFGAWLDLEKRKLTVPPSQIITTFNSLKKSDTFEIIPISKK
ncbi:MAG: thioesterase family protein [Flavobacteriaceae bacterium]|nr:thioesterase family protein [Flavobacteriaceae bacterium]